MTTRTWLGGTGDFTTPSNWSNGAPIFGDTGLVSAGIATLSPADANETGYFDAETIELGSTTSAAPAQLSITETNLARYMRIDSGNANPFAALVAIGTNAFGGLLNIDANGGTFSLVTEPSASTKGDFVVLQSAYLHVSNDDTLVVSGRMDVEGPVTIDTGSLLVNNGNVNVLSTQQKDPAVFSAVAGTGTIGVGTAAGVEIIDAIANTQTFKFVGQGGAVQIDTVSDFHASFVNFLPGDSILLTNVPANSASYNVNNHTISAFETIEGTPFLVAQFAATGPTSSGALQVTPTGLGGVSIGYVGAPSPESFAIVTGDVAMGANTVRATLTTHGGAPITGKGISVGILSGSFNALGGADTDARNGFLPYNTATLGSAVTILKEGSGEDEGRAMAELIHQVAPGAQLYFYAPDGSITDFGAGITALANAGCNIIVDDLDNTANPFFQVAGPVDTAIQSAINSGISYFTAADNFGNAYYQAAFTPVSTTLPGISGTVEAQKFTDGSNLQTITLSATTTIALQWDAPYPTTAGGSSVQAMDMALYQNGTLKSTAVQEADPGDGFASIPEIKFDNVAPGTYQLAIYQTAGMPSVGTIEYNLFGGGSGTGPGGFIDDPAAMNGVGNVFGQTLIPRVNTVESMPAGNAPFYTGDGFLEEIASVGPGQLLFDSNGNRLPTPVEVGKPNFSAPDGVYMSPDLTDFQPFYGTSAAAPDAAGVAALMLQADPDLTPEQVTSFFEQSAVTLGQPVERQGAGLVQAVGAVELALAAACYAAGTRILTDHGERPVEALRPGDRVVASYALRTVRWVGRTRIILSGHPDPDAVLPIRITAGALGQNQPHRDLLVSPDHALLIDEVLVPAYRMLNGATIRRDYDCTSVDYHHIELDTHDLLLAEGVRAESYLDTGNRSVFDQAAGVVDMFPRRIAAAHAAVVVGEGRPSMSFRKASASGGKGP